MFKDISNIINDAMSHGKHSKTINIDGLEFVLTQLDSKETLIADSTSVVQEIQKIFTDDKNPETDYFVTIDLTKRASIISTLSFAIKSVSGMPVHEKNDSPKLKLKKAKKFREEVLFNLSIPVIDKLIVGYNELNAEIYELYKDVDDTLKK